MLFGIQPEQFDVLGALAFLFVTIVALVGVRNPQAVPRWVFILLLPVGLAGLIVDLAIIVTYML